MKLRGFRPHRIVPGVEVWENDVFDVPLRRVLTGHLASVEPGLVTGPNYAPDQDEVLRCALGERQGPVGFRTAEGVERRVELGLVAGSSFLGMLDFLTTRYVPLASGPFEQLCRRAAAGSLASSISFLKMTFAAPSAPMTATFSLKNSSSRAQRLTS